MPLDLHALKSAPAMADVLALVGERVRRARAARGMSRKLLARDSGVSERHLAELEAGRGNVSVLLLAQVAAALNVPLEALVRTGPDPGPAHRLVDALLRRLSPEQLDAAQHLLARHFIEHDLDGRRERIALIGLRGAGKSTLGALLAHERQVAFVELDREIQSVSGLPLDAIFDVYGQAGFRRFERQALEIVLEREPRFVLATSGSIVSEPDTFGRLLTACRTVWLRALPTDHMERVIAQGDMRPMTGNREAMADLEQILTNRESMYGRADVAVETSGRTIEATLAELRERLDDPHEHGRMSMAE